MELKLLYRKICSFSCTRKVLEDICNVITNVKKYPNKQIITIIGNPDRDDRLLLHEPLCAPVTWTYTTFRSSTHGWDARYADTHTHTNLETQMTYFLSFEIGNSNDADATLEMEDENVYLWY